MPPKRKTLEDKCQFTVDQDMVMPWTPPTTEQTTLKPLKELTTEDTKALLRFFKIEHNPKDKKEFLTQELRDYFISKGFKQAEDDDNETQQTPTSSPSRPSSTTRMATTSCTSADVTSWW